MDFERRYLKMKNSTRFLIWVVALVALGPIIISLAQKAQTVGQWVLLVIVTAIVANWLSNFISADNDQ